MTPRDYDLVVLGDFRFPGGTSTAIAEELNAGAAAGYRIGLVQIKGPVLRQPHPFHPRIRACIDEGRVALLDPDRPVAARLVLVHHPSLFTHRPLQGLHVTAERKLLVVWHPPLDGAGAPAYDWAAIDRNTRGLLGDDLLWAPVGPLVRAQFDAIEDRPPLFPDDWHSMVDLDAWRVDRSGFVDNRPVIGRHSRPDLLKWPDTRDMTLAAYPDDPRYLVRVLGGGPFLLGLARRLSAQLAGPRLQRHARRSFLAGSTSSSTSTIRAGSRRSAGPSSRPWRAARSPSCRRISSRCSATPRSTPSRRRRGTWSTPTAATPGLSPSRSSAAGRLVRSASAIEAYVERLHALIGPPRPTRSRAAAPRTVPRRGRCACCSCRRTASASAI